MNFEISDLRAFVATADLGSFRAAADALHLSASALSRRIEKLEEVLGVRLFERTTRKMDLTIVGRGFLERAHRILNEVDNSMLEFDDLARKMTGELTVACVPSAVRYFLPETIATYHQRYPGIRLRLIDEPSSMVFLAVARGEADFGLTYVGTEEPDIEFTPLLDDPFVLACPRSHPLAKRKSVAWAELAGLEYLAIAQGSGNRAVIDEALAGAAERPKWFCEVRHVPALVSLIEAGLGVGVVPRLAMPRGPHKVLASVALVDPPIRRTLGVIQRRGRGLSSAGRFFLQLLTEMRAPGVPPASATA
ncbi:LysR family transcriptional regulator [Burkholderia cenocepacia]|uniref:LysR family transcriptional regulator n=1 Tax=Burkholderia cenocepacia TaxID=95486 RepID=UPI000F5A9E5E|nr:LysR family transcriptional regulator [Burkholderia cenocepacia]MBR8507299.1 LysR family transcriptional regulator [Burkholderia cenocepacia]MDS0850244.1 LysR substrate-binding domain-containing protein [Burkholderia cenocepacia]RQV64169.1 LysR family transcriptional regulator [Burkholderia cenocepacia]